MFDIRYYIISQDLKYETLCMFSSFRIMSLRHVQTKDWKNLEKVTHKLMNRKDRSVTQ